MEPTPNHEGWDDDNHPPTKPIYPIRSEVADELCVYIANGDSLEDACHKLNVPFYGLEVWMTLNGELNEKIQKAIKMRADHWAHKIMKDVDTIVTKDEAPGAKLQFDKLKWLAEMDNPDKYGAKSKHTVDVTQNITISTKNLSKAEAIKILNEDPFSIPLEADYRKLEEEISKDDSPKEYSL